MLMLQNKNNLTTVLLFDKYWDIIDAKVTIDIVVRCIDFTLKACHARVVNILNSFSKQSNAVKNKYLQRENVSE